MFQLIKQSAIAPAIANYAMGYQFENDIFISYAHLDNESLIQGQPEGWVADFDYSLKVFLQQLLGEKPNIWRDRRQLDGNDYLNDTIIGILSNVALLIPILSPRYVQSDWCLKELREFCRAAEKNGGVKLANKSRIFKVVKTPLEPNQHPEELQDLLGFEFYQVDPATNKLVIYDRIFGSDAQQYFLGKLLDLAHAIKECIAELKNRCPVPTPEPKGTVYLAQTTSDRNAERDKIRRELQQHGYTVLPEQPLPLSSPDFEAAVVENLQRCKLSIHLIGEKYGVIPEGAEKSVVDLQNQLAASYSQEKSGFSRLIWMPVKLQAKESNQQEFIQDLKTNPAAQRGADILQTSLEDLKTIVQDKLHPAVKQLPLLDSTLDSPQRIYLICDRLDLEAIAPIKQYLFAQGFEVILPLFDGDQTEVRQWHQENLGLCEGAMIYYGKANERWVQVQLGELRKAAGYGRTKPMLAKAIYLAAPDTPQKQSLQTHEALVLQGTSPDTLIPFLTKIKGEGR